MRLFIAVICLFIFAGFADAGPIRNFIQKRKAAKATSCATATATVRSTSTSSFQSTAPPVTQNCANGSCKIQLK